MGTMNQLNYVDIDQLSPEAQDDYREVCSKQGINNGEYYCWEFHTNEWESNAESWTDVETCAKIDASLRELGVKEEDNIHIYFGW